MMGRAKPRASLLSAAEGISSILRTRPRRRLRPNHPSPPHPRATKTAQEATSLRTTPQHHHAHDLPTPNHQPSRPTLSRSISLRPSTWASHPPRLRPSSPRLCRRTRPLRISLPRRSATARSRISWRRRTGPLCTPAPSLGTATRRTTRRRSRRSRFPDLPRHA